MLTDVATVGFSHLRALSPDGRSKAFDAGANGYARGEGAGIVVLKRLSDAVADGDPIYAVIRGGAINQDGRTNGLTAPNRFSQEAVLRQAVCRCRSVPRRRAVRRGSRHRHAARRSDRGRGLGRRCGSGTSCGTTLPDRIREDKHRASGIGRGRSFGDQDWRWLCTERTIPASLHFQTPNPHIAFDALRLRVQDRTSSWPATDGPARAGVSGFGFGGTNAHLVLEEAPGGRASRDNVSADQNPQLLVLSARSEAALKDLAGAFGRYVESDEGRQAMLAEICQYAATKRTHHRFRLSVVAQSHDQLAADLRAFAEGEPRSSTSHGRRRPSGPPQIGFALSKLDAGLLESLLTARTGLRAQFESFSGNDACVATAEQNSFRRQYALALLWRSWGVEPSYLGGGSSADLLASCLSEHISLAEALAALPAEEAGEAIDATALTAEELDQMQQEGLRLLVLLGALDTQEAIAVPSTVTILPSLRQGETSEPLLAALGTLYSQGVDIDWTRFYGSRVARRLTLPNYPFQQERYPWKTSAPVVETTRSVAAEQPVEPKNAAGSHPLLSKHFDALMPIFESQLDLQRFAFLADHQVGGKIVTPGAALVELALASAAESFPGQQLRLENVRFEHLLPLEADEVRTLQIILNDASEETTKFQIHARSRAVAPRPAAWIPCASGTIVRSAAPTAMPAAAELPETIARRLGQERLPSQLYAELAQFGLNYGPNFQAIERIWSSAGETLGQVALPRALRSKHEPWQLHPVTLDACLQVIAAALPDEALAGRQGAILVPARIGAVYCYAALPSRVWSHCTLRTASLEDSTELTADVQILDEEGRLLAKIEDIRFAGFPAARRTQAANQPAVSGSHQPLAGA